MSQPMKSRERVRRATQTASLPFNALFNVQKLVKVHLFQGLSLFAFLTVSPPEYLH